MGVEEPSTPAGRAERSHVTSPLPFHITCTLIPFGVIVEKLVPEFTTLVSCQLSSPVGDPWVDFLFMTETGASQRKAV